MSTNMPASAGLYTRQVGPPDSVPIVFLHPSGSNATAWDNHLDVLGRHHRCVAVDLPGHRYSRGMPWISLAAAAESVADLIDGSLGGRAHLVGLSLGGSVALTVLEQHPAARPRDRRWCGRASQPVGVASEGRGHYHGAGPAHSPRHQRVGERARCRRREPANVRGRHPSGPSRGLPSCVLPGPRRPGHPTAARCGQPDLARRRRARPEGHAHLKRDPRPSHGKRPGTVPPRRRARVDGQPSRGACADGATVGGGRTTALRTAPRNGHREDSTFTFAQELRRVAHVLNAVPTDPRC
jgi:pimeloyl-ACP methyl ester carboxylesterase